MENIIVFMFKSCFAMFALYAVYLIFLRNETFFTMNRFYLLGTLIASLVLPLIQIPLHEIISIDRNFEFSFNNIIIKNEILINNKAGNFGFINYSLLVYAAISCFLLIRFLIRLSQIFNIIIKGEIKKYDGFKIILTDYDIIPFSFFNYVFINPQKLSDDETSKILIHELVHIKEFHTIDLILIEIVSMVLWFNPVVWLIKSSLKATHEYIADRYTVFQTKNKIEYQKLLLKEAFGGYQFDFTNNFNFSLIKRRITMMTKNVSNRTARLKVLFVMPVAVILLFTFAFTGGSNTSIAGELKKDSKAKKEKFVKVDEMPSFDQSELAKAIKYPEEARKSVKSGKVMCRVLVSKEGLVSKIEIVKSQNKIFDKPAIEALEKIKFTPAKLKGEAVETWVTIPITFKLK
jgi:TonB family protein